MAQNKPGRRVPSDHYEVRSTEMDSPARFAYEINTRGRFSCNTVPRALYVGTSGNVYCRPAGVANNQGTANQMQFPITLPHANIFFMNVVAGTILPIRVDNIWIRNELDLSQNTTASHIVGLY